MDDNRWTRAAASVGVQVQDVPRTTMRRKPPHVQGALRRSAETLAALIEFNAT